MDLAAVRISTGKNKSPIPGWATALLVGGTLIVLILLEWRRPLRRRVETKVRHTVRNLAMAGMGSMALQLTELPVTRRLTRLAVARRWGLLQNLSLPLWLESLVGTILLDYTLYWWHLLTHKVPFLWRFHKVHHVDLDLDASTALRFHFGELMLSVLFRALQIRTFGISWATLSVWNTALLVEIMFHHSNVELPASSEQWISKVIATPRMHGIHHSVIEGEMNSNWSSGLSLWDWLHGTLHRDVPQREILIGTSDFQRAQEITLPKLIVLPLRGLPSPPKGQIES
jgi:sterol desaturase/sphingolipid hydroxylase (fatty acid hydroxylase superfamily)